MLYTNFLWYETGEPQRMRVLGGKVVARGTDVPEALAGEETLDLGGRVLHPGYYDSHCHILPLGLDLEKLHLGAANSAEEVLALVRDQHAKDPEGWLHAVHYDQNKYGGEHLTRHDLDKISTTRPILLRHVNGHASVANSAALIAAGITETTRNPKGGEFRRDASGSLDGVLLETAHEIVTNASPLPSLEEMVSAILHAGRRMRGFGIFAAADMMTGRFDLAREIEAYRLAAERGMEIRVRLYVQWSTVFGKRAVPGFDELKKSLNPETVRVAGIKLFADGAIGSATAATYGEYPSGGNGSLIYAPEELTRRVQIAYDAGYQVATHTIGDRSTDIVLDAYESTGEPSRHRIEHAMILSDAQIDRISKTGCPVSFQPEFLAQFGHAYLRQLGAERASKLKRTRSVIDAGIPLAFSSDLPIVNGNPADGMRAATNRPAGFDPTENCTEVEAIRAYTTEAAKICGDGDSVGSLLPGQWADFNP